MACAVLLGTSGCDELDARRKIQEAGKLYQRGEFAQAAELYEKVLEDSPPGEVTEVARYNAGITYNKMFRPGVSTPENLQHAENAARHFAEYLKIQPDDTTVVGLMTQIWLDSGQHENALQYWQEEHRKNPKDSEIIAIVAGIHRQAGEWEKAIEWHYKEAEVLDSPGAKANAYMNIGKLTSNKLFNRTKVVWFERLRIADIGITALQKALELDPDNPEIHTFMGILYSLRSEAHQASWAQVIDKSHGRYYHSRSAALKKAMKKEESGGASATEDGDASDSPEDGEEASEDGSAGAGEGEEAEASEDGSAGAGEGEEAEAAVKKASTETGAGTKGGAGQAGSAGTPAGNGQGADAPEARSNTEEDKPTEGASTSVTGSNP